MSKQKTLFDTTGSPEIINCKRCGARCRLSDQPGEKAKMLRFAQGPGLCVNCAVHDWLRNTYPPNILLAQSGPKVLLYPHIQKEFAGIMRVGFADAKPDEIDWQRIVENWDLPFPHKMKPGPSNPCSQKELEEIAAGTRPGLSSLGSPSKAAQMLSDCNGDITSFEQLNELEPGLGDKFRSLLRRHET